MTDITRTRGDTVADVINVKNNAGAALDVTGYSFLLSVNSLENPPNNTTEIYQLTGTIVDAAAGVVEFAPSAVQADQIPYEYWYDIQMTDLASRIKTIAKGKYTYTQDITK